MKNAVKIFCSAMRSIVAFSFMVVVMSSCASHKSVTSYVDTIIYDNDSVTTKAEFSGGQGEYYRYLNNNFEYPYHAKLQGEKGKGIYAFVVNQEGSVQDVEVIQSVGYSIDKAMVRLIEKMPRWEPATHNGDPVSVRMRIEKDFGSKGKAKKGYDVPARFGGDPLALENYLKEHSDRTRKVGMSGLVKVSFVIDEKGDVTNPRIVQGLNGQANSTALSIVRSMPRWTPALKKDKPVQMNKTISIYFTKD